MFLVCSAFPMLQKHSIIVFDTSSANLNFNEIFTDSGFFWSKSVISSLIHLTLQVTFN